MISKERLLEYMRHGAYRPVTVDQLMEDLEIDKGQQKMFKQLLQEMEDEGLVARSRKGRYAVPERFNLVVGKLQGHAKGFGFVVPVNPDFEDVFISPEHMGGAMHGDRVIAMPFKQSDDARNWEGRITKVIERVNHTVVGTMQRKKTYGFVVPDDSRIAEDVFVPGDKLEDARNGEKVVVEITEWPKGRHSPEGRVINRLGPANEPGVDILSIIHKYHLEGEFPPEVKQQVEQIPDLLEYEDYLGREDLRSIPMVTIDGETAKDFDDAVSLQRGEGKGTWRLGVHIADVTHYVREGSPLDKEALRRGTSAYLVDRVIPMLPEKLSNGLCSLNPKVDRLALSVLMDISASGEVLDHQIVESVIRSNERLTYTKVHKILEGDEELRQEYERYVDMLEDMEELRKALRERRDERGSIDFDFPETELELDEDGKPVDVRVAERSEAHQLIEEFMVLCNRVVAEHFYWLEIPFLYRIHEDPDPADMEHFHEFVWNLGLKLPKKKEYQPKDLQAVLREIDGQDVEQLVTMVMLRSMKRARYSVDCLGHFGLALRFYTHFTSPIRRYPDLQIHRIIKQVLHGELDERLAGRLARQLPEVAEHCSEAEREAEAAERETMDLKKVQWMKGKEGEVYEGIISNVTGFGLFVALPSTIEGLVHVRDLDDDYYEYNEKTYTLSGKRTGKSFHVGQHVKVVVTNVDVDERKVDFSLADEEEDVSPEG